MITKANNHNKSVGEYFSFENRANFGVIYGSSVAQYTYKKIHNTFTDSVQKVNNELFEDMSFR